MSHLQEHQNKVDLLTKEISALDERVQKLTPLRLVLLVVLFIGGFLVWEFGVLAILAVITSIVIGFVIVSFKETQLKNQASFLINQRSVFQKEIDLLNRNFEGLEEGKEFIIPNHNYSHDLDVFGYKSLFQFLNRTSTHKGKQLLGKWLNTPLTNSQKIKEKQKAVKELSEKAEWGYKLLAFGKASNDKAETQDTIDNWLADKPFLSSPGITIVKFLLPLITIGTGACAIMELVPTSYFTGLFLIQLGISARFASRITQTQSKLGSRFAIIENYIKIVESIESQKFESNYLLKLQKVFINKDEGFSVSNNLGKLKGLLDKLDARLNIYLAIVLNGLFLWDIHVTSQVEKWKKNYGENLKQWMNATGEFDAILSLALFASNHPNYTYPQITQNSKELHFINFGHPLIHENQLVKNSYSISGDSKVDLLTGANMAGKSTFLRSIGVNLILGRIGAPVCADEFKFSPFKLFSSLRTVDSLKDNESFFYAELKRLKQLIELYKQGEEIFFLLDEILKGTNSADQHKGSVGLIENLIELKASGVIATHDIKLANLESQFPESVRNLCFEIEIINDELKFDYTVKPGFCRTMNASFLMESMGIIKK